MINDWYFMCNNSAELVDLFVCCLIQISGLLWSLYVGHLGSRQRLWSAIGVLPMKF